MAGKHRAVKIFAAGAAAAALGILTYSESRPAADEINDASLIIGTYLIDFEALNEENQALAEKNAEDKNQPRVFYKSDLNSGVWYDITDAENVNDILLTNSRIVDSKTIDGLELTLYFKADGTVVDLATGNVVSVQNVDSSVDPAQIDACSSIVQQLEIANSLVESTADYDEDNDQEAHQHSVYLAEQEALTAILAPVSDDETTQLSGKLNALDPVLNAADGAAAESVAALKVKLRAQLDKHCCEVVNARIEEQITKLSSPDKSDHADLISALSDVQSALLEDIATLDSSAGTGTGTAADKQSELEEKLVAAAESGDSAEAAAQADKLAVLDALVNGSSVEADKAAEMAEELYQSAMDSISELSASVNNGTNDFFTDGSGVTSEDVKTAFTAAIKDAENFARDSAMYAAGNASSPEYSSLAADKLDKLGKLLEQLPAGSGGLAGEIAEIAADSASDILEKAAAETALADSSIAAEKSRLDELQKQIDGKYDEYIDALSSGSSDLADQKKSELDALTEELAQEQDSAAAMIDGKYGELFDAKNALSADQSGDQSAAEKARTAQAEKDALKSLISSTDAGLLDQFDDSLAAFEEQPGESAYDELRAALVNVPAAYMSDDTRAKALTYAAGVLRNNGISELDSRLQADIAAAQTGQLTPESTAPDSSVPDALQPAGGSALDDLYQYRLVIPKYDIYSDELTLELNGTVFVNSEKLAELIGAQFIRANDVYVIKGEDILIEFTAGDAAAYIGDKLLALADPPQVIAETAYVPSGLIAAGLGLAEMEENGTLFMR